LHGGRELFAMLRRKTIMAPSQSHSGLPQCALWPAWALVVFWLLAILFLAVGLALGANYVALHGRSARAQVDEPDRIAATAAVPTGSLPSTPATRRTAGVVVLEQQHAPTAAPPAGTPASLGGVLPTEVLLQEVPIGKQTRSLNCEFQTASDLAWYYGRPFTWEEIYRYVGHDAGGNPHKGFVGRSFDDEPGQLYPFGYGVYAEPIAGAFAQLGLRAAVSYHTASEWLKAQLAAGRPVMVWATSGMIIRPVATWTAADGVTVKGVPGEHTYLAVGYDATGVWLIDPWDGQRHHFEWPAFLASWDLLDRMALVVTGEPLAVVTPTPGA